MRAKGSLALRFAVLCGIAAIAGAGVHGQFLEPPDANFFGDDFVKTIDIRNDAIVADNDAPRKESPSVEGYEHLLVFRDGRQLRGRLASVGKDEIIWKRPDFSEPLRLRRADARCVYLKPGMPGILNADGPTIPGLEPISQSAPDKPLPATVKLGGDDWLRGFVTSPDGQNFIVRLDDDGTSIATPRSQTEWLFFDPNEARGGGFDGSILNAQDWLASAPSATLLEDGTLMIPKPDEWFGRFLPQPALFEISMEIPADSEPDIHLWLQPSAPMPEALGPGSVDVGLGPKRLFLRRLANATNAMEQKSIPISQTGGPDSGAMVHFRIFYDSDKQRLVIFRNGRNVADWKPAEPKREDVAEDPILLQNSNYILLTSIRNLAAGAAMAGAVNALHPSPDGLWMGSIPSLIATAPISCFAAQLIISQQNARFPRITGICLISRNGDERKSRLKIRRFRVSPWDGVLPKEGKSSATGDELSSASLGLIAGKLESITAERIIFSQRSEPKLPGTLLRLPHESGAPWEPVARADLGGAGEVGISALNIREGKAHLRTAFADDAEVPAAMLGAITFPTASPPAPAGGAALVFKNGDELEGSLVCVTDGAPLRWKLRGGQEVGIEIKRIAGVRLAAPAPSKPIAVDALVELRDGDHLRGAVTSFDENQLVLKEPLLGQLSFGRSRIWKLFPHSTAAIRDGADDPAGWMSANFQVASFLYGAIDQSKSSAKPAWLYLDGCYLPRQTQNPSGEVEPRFLSTAVPHQDNGLFELRAEFTGAGGNLPTAIISIVGKQKADGPSSAVCVSFANTVIFLNVVNSHGQAVRQAALGSKLLSTRLNFRVFVNSVLGTADVLLNGALVARVGQQANERSPGIDSEAQFGGMAGDGSSAILSNLWIGPWDGELPRPETARSASTTLANGDTSTSIPSALKDGSYLLETEVGQVRLPAASLSAIAFGGKLEPGRCAARLRLIDGSVVHVSGIECRDRALIGRSAIFGEFRLPLESLAEIIFDPAPFREPLGPQPKTPPSPQQPR